MDIADFLEKFADDLGCGRDEISAETRFRELSGWTSLQALMTLSMIEEEFGVLLKSDDFKKSETLGDLFAIVAARKK